MRSIIQVKGYIRRKSRNREREKEMGINVSNKGTEVKDIDGRILREKGFQLKINGIF